MSHLKVLVTGGLGFVGSNLTRALLNDGHLVTVVDNLTRDADFGLKAKEEFWDKHRGHFNFHMADIRDEATLRTIVQGHDTVFHLAALVNVRESVRNPKATMDVNLGGTSSLLEACRFNDVSRFVFASTIAVYGRPVYKVKSIPSALNAPYNEEHPTQPISPYGVSKLAGENLVRVYGELYGLKTVSLRFSNIYGNGGAGVISVFLRNIQRGEPITVYGGEQTEDFIHVNPAVDAYELCLSPKADGVYNIGSGEVVSILGLVELIRWIIAEPFEVRSEPSRSGEIKSYTVDCQKAKLELGWLPYIGLREGIRLMALELGLELSSGFSLSST